MYYLNISKKLVMVAGRWGYCYGLTYIPPKRINKDVNMFIPPYLVKSNYE